MAAIGLPESPPALSPKLLRRLAELSESAKHAGRLCQQFEDDLREASVFVPAWVSLFIPEELALPWRATGADEPVQDPVDEALFGWDCLGGNWRLAWRVDHSHVPQPLASAPVPVIIGAACSMRALLAALGAEAGRWLDMNADDDAEAEPDADDDE